MSNETNTETAPVTVKMPYSPSFAVDDQAVLAVVMVAIQREVVRQAENRLEAYEKEVMGRLERAGITVQKGW